MLGLDGIRRRCGNALRDKDKQKGRLLDKPSKSRLKSISPAPFRA